MKQESHARASLAHTHINTSSLKGSYVYEGEQGRVVSPCQAECPLPVPGPSVEAASWSWNAHTRATADIINHLSKEIAMVDKVIMH
jgi:hypothetical protein